MATAVPIRTFKAQYTGEWLTVSKFVRLAEVRLTGPGLAAARPVHGQPSL
jgi:hypothetical protein